MRYPLQSLLDIRLIREDDAARQVVMEKNRLEQARKAVEDRKSELKEYISWRIREEDSRYAGILRKQIRLAELHNLRTEVSLFRENELLKEKKILEAESTADSARSSLEKARLAQVAAGKDRQKIDEHKDYWTELWEKEQNHLADLELEDLFTRRREVEEEEEEEEYREQYEHATD